MVVVVSECSLQDTDEPVIASNNHQRSQRLFITLHPIEQFRLSIIF